MSSELSGAETDRPRETGPVTRDSGGPPEVPADAGDNPTMSLSELYERRDAGTGPAGPALDDGPRGTETGADSGSSPADEGPDAGYPAYDDGYPADTPYEGYGANEAIDGQVVSDPGADSDPVPDWEAGNGDSPAEAVGDAGLVADDGGYGGDDSRFDGWPDAEPAVVADDVPYDREGAVGGQEADGELGFFGRAEELKDRGEAETGERQGNERAGPGTQSSADASQQGERGEETAGEQDAEGQGEGGREEKPRDLAPVQSPVPDAETDRPTEAVAEAAPDQLVDDPRMAAMEARMAEFASMFESMQAKLEASEAKREEDKVGFEQEIGDLRAENSELKQKVAEIEEGQGERQAVLDRPPDSSDDLEPVETDSVTEPVTRPDALGNGDEADADTADLAGAINSEADQEASRLPEKPERSGYSQETVDFWKSAAGVAQAAGFTFPGADLITGGQATRRAFEKMTPDEQVATMGVGNAAGIAISGMDPFVGLAALGVSIALPVAQDKFRNMADKLRRRGHDAG